MNDKKSIRHNLLQLRASLSPAERAARSRKIALRVCELPAWQAAREVLLYVPFRNEVDTWPLIHQVWAGKGRVVLPRCSTCSPGEMEWGQATCREDLQEGAFGILEPHPQRCETVDQVAPDLVVVPGVGFDRRGFRVGYGGGYYDRFLTRPEVSASLTIGLGFGFQLVDRLPQDPWDVPLRAIATEKEMVWIS